jgi:predicted acylesterase/phospholipase RssA
VQGLTLESGIFDNSPLTATLGGYFKDHNSKLNRKMSVSCLNVNTGNYVVFDENTDPNVIKNVVASASIPFIFPHQVYPDGIVCMDGGTGYNLNIVSAV